MHRSFIAIALGTSLGSSVAHAQFFPCDFTYVSPPNFNAGASVLVDIDGDGDRDIVTNREGGYAAMLSVGWGAYSVVTSAGQNTETTVGGLACGDFNNDGKLDVARSSYENNNPSLARVVVAFGNGTGTFSGEIQLSAGNWATQVEVADIDGDSDADIVCGTELNGIQVWKSNGNGTFGTRASYAAGSINRQMELKDISGDGKPDVVLVNETSNQISVLINSGTGTFPTRVTYATGSYPTGLMVADFDNDGDRDVAFGHRYTTEIRFLKNNGTGTLTAWQTIPNPVGGAIAWLAAGDFDGDGDTDFSCFSGYGGTATWRHFTNNKGGVFTGGALESSPAVGWVGVAGNIDADVKPDILICENNSGTTAVTYRGLTTTCPPCPGDVSGDGVVNAVDLNILLATWGNCPG